MKKSDVIQGPYTGHCLLHEYQMIFNLRISHGYCKTSMPKIFVVFVYNYLMKNSLRNSVSPVIRIFDEIVREWTSNSTSLYRKDPQLSRKKNSNFIGINKSLFFGQRIQL